MGDASYTLLAGVGCFPSSSFLGPCGAMGCGLKNIHRFFGVRKHHKPRNPSGAMGLQPNLLKNKVYIITNYRKRSFATDDGCILEILCAR